MNNVINPTINSFKESPVYTLLHSKELGTVKAPNEAEVTAFTNMVLALNKKKRTRDVWLAAIILATFGGVVRGLFINSDFLFAIFTFAFAAACTITAGDNKYSELREFEHSGSSLESVEKCNRALNLAKDFEECEAYRQEVLVLGREFCQLDLQLMEKIAALRTQHHDEVLAKQLCQELHGIRA